ncbi:PDR/VanB family oxidoreductase [Streptomyces mirabilis]|uniref:PDR/VanB family oxidoreductase n=1 Tax=Streptomyces mirabilis TaxID=68239 RepID=UPI0036549896
MNANDIGIDLKLQVTGRTRGAEGIVVLDLSHPEGQDLPSWSPGAHVELELPTGLRRHYSLCGRPEDRSRWRIAVLREPLSRGGSACVHETLHEGRLVQVRGLHNGFELVPAPQYLFLAGGIGITPILPMIAAAAAAGSDWELHYGGRNRRSMAFLEPLQQMGGGRVSVYPQDEVGLLDLDRILGTPRPDALVYCCGPEPLLQAVEERCSAWPTEALHVERFAPKADIAPARREAFEIELALSGLTLAVPPDESVLEVIESAGVGVLSSCREGICGTCETRVLEGRVDHRDSLLTAAEQAANETMLICVSRAAGHRIVLDL